MLKNLFTRAGIPAALTVAAGNAMAALPTEASTALSDGKTDVAALGLASFLIVLGIAVWRYMKRGL